MNALRLGWNPNTAAVAALTDVRLSLSGYNKAAPNSLIGEPTLRLSYTGNRIPVVSEIMRQVEVAPALLISYVYLRNFLKVQSRLRYRNWTMDSGAFSAFNSGTSIDMAEYTDTCKRLLAEDPSLTEVFALDVIGDWKGSLKNTERMWADGIQAIPTFHGGEPWEALEIMARDYPKIALGGVVRKPQKFKLWWCGQCFARVWPKKIHGLGMASEGLLMAYPFHSTDATNWEIGPVAYGRWQTFGNLSIRGSNQNLRVEVAYYLALEARLRSRWAKEMALLEAL